MTAENAPWDAEWCPLCDVHLDLHFGDDDCENASRRADLVSSFGRLRGH